MKNFTLIWNIFENRIFASSFSVEKLEAVIANREFDAGQFDELLAYFRSRYIENGELNWRYQYLKLRPNDKQDLVTSVLTTDGNTLKEKILAIGIIVYRYRNNLFHGVKDFETLHLQKDNFSNAIAYIKRLL